MPILKSNAWTQIREYFLIAAGILIYVLGWTIFLVPNNMVGGGVTGISSIVQYATGGAVKMGYTYFIINVALIVAGILSLGKSFGGKTVFAIVLASVGLNLFQELIPVDSPFIQTFVLQDNNKLMCTIMGGIMVGFGIGLTMSAGGSTGGTDIIALIVNKHRNVSPGRMILIMDVIIICSSLLVPSYTADGGLVPFVDKILTVVYGLILITISSNVLDIYLSGSRQSLQLFILSRKYEEIADAITHDLRHGVTVLDGEGWYTKQPCKVLMVMIRKSDLKLCLRYIKTIDPDVFMSVTSAAGVYGRGFESIKVQVPKQEPKQ